MHAKYLALGFGLLLPAIVFASGWRSPAHAQLNYSFTCPGGASGHASYSLDASDARRSSELRIWVAGSYIQNDPKVASFLASEHIESVSASCEGENTLIALVTWNIEKQRQQTVTIYVDQAGKVVAAGV